MVPPLAPAATELAARVQAAAGPQRAHGPLVGAAQLDQLAAQVRGHHQFLLERGQRLQIAAGGDGQGPVDPAAGRLVTGVGPVRALGPEPFRHHAIRAEHQQQAFGPGGGRGMAIQRGQQRGDGAAHAQGAQQLAAGQAGGRAGRG
jgi:hypothetical protein